MRTPLSGKEYAALQTLFAVVSGFDTAANHLEKRAKEAGCWERIETIRSLAAKAMDEILATVPEKKLAHISQDIRHIRVYLKIEAPGLASRSDKQYSYTPTATLNDLINHLVQTECIMCDKTAVESRKCPYRQTIEDALPHEVDGTDREHCKYSDMVLGLEVGE